MMFSSCLATARVEFYAKANELHQVKDKPDIEIRLKQVDDLIESYFAVTGEVPQPKALNRLSDYLLVDVLSDRLKPFRKDEFPIQSSTQIRKRQQRYGLFEYKEDVGA